jgi:pyruvate,water dikinase
MSGRESELRYSGRMSNYVLGLHEVDRTMISLVGGKGANLGELSHLRGIHVPAGFCVTTEAFPHTQEIDALHDRGDELRRAIEATPIRPDVEREIRLALAELGDPPVAVRSSATAEDLPDASFAGQQDTYLNVVGADAVLHHVRRCWASLFTERAIAYRNEHHIDYRRVRMAVVVQTMVPAEVAGVLFTADPITSNRTVTSIEAVRGLGESLVSGMANPDRYRVRKGRIERNGSLLSDSQILRLERLGREIEAHFGDPQDIEWCLVGDEISIVQSRPITTLFPIPRANEPGNHVYVSVGHSQMMTDALKPLGLSFWQLIAGRPMHTAGGRLFVDLTKELASPATRDATVAFLGRSDPLIRDALETIVARNFVEPVAAAAPLPGAAPPIYNAPVETDPAVVADLIARSEAELETLKRDIATRSGTALFDFLRDHIEETKKKSAQDQRNIGAIMASVNAAAWLNEKMLAWLGEKNAADTLAQSAPNNVTSAMGLELLDVADVVRRHPAVVAYLEREDSLDDLAALEGGPEVRDAIGAFLEKYGMRCAGEIDITRPRWSEKPTTLVPLILSNVKNFEPGEAQRKFDRGREEAMRLRDDLLRRLRQLPDGEQKANETERMIDQLRNFCGYREYPKYGIVNRYFVYKQALLREAARLVEVGVIRDVDDVSFLTFDELREVVGTHRLDPEVIRRRRAEHERFEKLSPPRVMTSDGEVVPGAYKRGDLPAGAIVGLAVSSGIVEGRARVLRDMAGAHLEPGDILVTRFTDPSWTPVFVTIAGLVTEVGGLMTHGAVIAREYGLPAIVGVENATRRIRDGQRIRVNGTDGYVELLG